MTVLLNYGKNLSGANDQFYPKQGFFDILYFKRLDFPRVSNFSNEVRARM